MTFEASSVVRPSWRCPVCQLALQRQDDERRWTCSSGHHFDIAKEGYVNLLVAGQRRARRPGDSTEMVAARRRFLATGRFDPLSRAVARSLEGTGCDVVVDVGCGDGRHTRAVTAPVVLGFDVSKAAVATAARRHPSGSYAVASAADVPLSDKAVDAATVIFGPVFPDELARVVRAGGFVVAAYPGPGHLGALRELVYAEARPHEIKAPLRDSAATFEEVDTTEVSFPVEVDDYSTLHDLFAMTPYRWHAPPDMEARLAAAVAAPFETVADIRLTRYRRRR